MDKLIAITALLLSLSVNAEQYPQAKKDNIRAYYVEQILNVKPDFVRMPSDVVASSYAFSKHFQMDQPRYPPMQPMEAFRVFSAMDIPLSDFFKIFSMAIGYDLTIHPKADLTEKLNINDAENKINTIGEYMDRVLNAQVGIYRESQVILVMPGLRIADTNIPE